MNNLPQSHISITDSGSALRSKGPCRSQCNGLLLDSHDDEEFPLALTNDAVFSLDQTMHFYPNQSTIRSNQSSECAYETKKLHTSNGATAKRSPSELISDPSVLQRMPSGVFICVQNISLHTFLSRFAKATIRPENLQRDYRFYIERNDANPQRLKRYSSIDMFYFHPNSKAIQLPRFSTILQSVCLSKIHFAVSQKSRVVSSSGFFLVSFSVWLGDVRHFFFLLLAFYRAFISSLVEIQTHAHRVEFSIFRPPLETSAAVSFLPAPLVILSSLHFVVSRELEAWATFKAFPFFLPSRKKLNDSFCALSYAMV